jgi:hypothetical protein
MSARPAGIKWKAETVEQLPYIVLSSRDIHRVIKLVKARIGWAQSVGSKFNDLEVRRNGRDLRDTYGWTRPTFVLEAES